ncbi:MAG: hypothetical protein Q8Q81_16095 [Oxalobacteraceae bacterium]|nr:hypothetical protein [Oxalobacteraceae bacterium]
MTRSIVSRWPRLTRVPLAVEITLALLLKLVLLFALWHAFFSDPQAKHMLVPAPQIEQHFLSDTALTPDFASTSPPPSHAEKKHGSD